MAQYLRPCVSLASWGPGNSGYYGQASFPQLRNPEFFSHSRTPWVRVWVRWDALQPNNGTTNPAADGSAISWWPGYTPQLYLALKANEIAQARAAGKKVVLQLHATPDWANATTRAQGANPRGNPNYMSPPWDTTQTGPFAYIVWFLAVYFNPLAPQVPGAYADFLEVVNEPNLEFWPQINTQGSYIMPYFAAAMLSTARYIIGVTGLQPLILGPGIADSERTDTSVSGIVHWRPFSESVLYLYPLYGVPSDQYIAWSIHNYGDVQDNGNRVATAVGLLDAYGWKGWPSGAVGGAYVLATEGGYRMPTNESATDLAVQSASITTAWSVAYMNPRVGMFTNYLMWSTVAPNNTGLCVKYPSGGPNPAVPTSAYERLALLDWAVLPTTVPR